MLKRGWAIGLVVLLLVLTAGLPGLSAPAKAAPRAVTVAVHDLAPFVLTHGNVKSGFAVDIMDGIARHLDWTLNYVDVGNVSAQLKAVSEGRADAANGAISITSGRTALFDFSQPTLGSGLQIVVPVGNTAPSTPNMGQFLRLLFSKTMLIWLSVAVLLAVAPAHIIWLMERRHADAMVSRSYFPGIFQAFTWGLGMLVGQPDDTPRHWVARMLAVLWAFVGIIFVAYYTATLTTNLTVQKITARISSPADLFGIKVCTVAGTTSATFLRQTGVEFIGVSDISGCYAGLKDSTFEAVVFDAPVLRYFLAHDGAGTGQLAGPVFETENYGIAFQIGSELRKQVDEALLLMREDGDYDLIRAKWFGAD